MNDDLSTRLLEAIEERERVAKSLRRERWFAVVDDLIGGMAVANVNKPTSAHDHNKGEGSIGDFLSAGYAEHVAAHGPLEVMALCQAHREIVDMYQQAEAKRGHWTIRDLDHASAMGRLTTLGLVLQALSRAYRIQEET